MPGIFISYRKADTQAWAVLLRDRLVRAFGERNVFLDVNTLTAGRWQGELNRALRHARAVVVLIGPHWVSLTDATGRSRLASADDVHRAEVVAALNEPGATVIPLLVGGARLPAASDLPEDLRPLLDHQVRELGVSGDRREAELESLVRVLQDITGQRRMQRLAWAALALAMLAALVNATMRWDSVVAAIGFLLFAAGTLGLAGVTYAIMRRERLKGAWPALAGMFIAGALLLGSLFRIGWLNGRVFAAEPRQVARWDIACLPDQPVMTSRDGTTNLRVWVTASHGAPVTENVRVDWAASGGRVSGASSPAQWSLLDAPAGRRYTAVADVRVDGVSAGRCELGVWRDEPLAAGTTRGEYVTRRTFLRADQFGEPGFGLYSYFLIREAATTPQAREKHTRFVRAFLDMLVSLGEQENHIARGRLNAALLLTTADPPKTVDLGALASWAVENYDYERARRLLSLYPSLSGAGPYIIAVPRPLRAPVRPMLPWDLAELDATAIASAVNQFLNQAAQLSDWADGAGLLPLRERLLTSITGLFVGRAAAERWLLAPS